jgi:hypothetical protein
LIADYTDTYVIEIKAKYKSDFYKEKLRVLDIDAMSPSQKAKIQNKESYRIDYANREVLRNFSKKFKFQTRSPFSIVQNTVVRKNKYYMEMTLENESHQLFLQSIQLKLNNPDLEWLDLNTHDEENELIGSVMKKKEIRSYIYILQPVNEHMKIKSNENVGIGTVELRWQNMFGDTGVIAFGPFIYLNEGDK